MSRATERFWSDAAAAPLVLLTDFDNTISQVDVGDLVTFELAPPSAETMARFGAKEIGTRLYWEDCMARVDMAAGVGLASMVALDPDFAPFVRWAEQQGIPIAVVSDGFGFYIEHLLKRDGLGDLPVFCNEMAAPGRLEWPHGNLACDFCGCCKAHAARRLKALGCRVIYVGDGVSDRYGAAYADWIFAKDWLASHLERRGSPHYPITGFAEVYRTLSANLAAFRQGTAERRSQLEPDPRCRFGED